MRSEDPVRRRHDERVESNMRKYSAFASGQEKGTTVEMQKRDLLAQINALEAKGFPPSRAVSDGVSLDDMKYELFRQTQNQERSMGLEKMRDGMMLLAHGIEMGNEYANPFGFKLKGFSRSIFMNMAQYDAPLLKLWTQWFSRGSASSASPLVSISFNMMMAAMGHHFGAQCALSSDDGGATTGSARAPAPTSHPTAVINTLAGGSLDMMQDLMGRPQRAMRGPPPEYDD